MSFSSQIALLLCPVLVSLFPLLSFPVLSVAWLSFPMLFIPFLFALFLCFPFPSNPALSVFLSSSTFFVIFLHFYCQVWCSLCICQFCFSPCRLLFFCIPLATMLRAPPSCRWTCRISAVHPTVCKCIAPGSLLLMHACQHKPCSLMLGPGDFAGNMTCQGAGRLACRLGGALPDG